MKQVQNIMAPGVWHAEEAIIKLARQRVKQLALSNVLSLALFRNISICAFKRVNRITRIKRCH